MYSINPSLFDAAQSMHVRGHQIVQNCIENQYDCRWKCISYMHHIPIASSVCRILMFQHVCGIKG